MSEENEDGGLIIGVSLSASVASMAPRTLQFPFSLPLTLPSPRQTKTEREDKGESSRQKQQTGERRRDKRPYRQKIMTKE